MRFEGKTAIVTGGAGGMGRATAVAFAQEGASVVVGDVDVAAGEALAAEVAAMGKVLTFQRCDVSVEADVIALVQTAERVYGKLDTIFNNAGIEQPVTPSTDVTEELFERVIGINLKGVFFGCKHAIPAPVAGGRRHHRQQLLRQRLRQCRREHLLRRVQGRGHVDDPRAGDRIRHAQHPGERHQSRRHRYRNEPPQQEPQS